MRIYHATDCVDFYIRPGTPEIVFERSHNFNFEMIFLLGISGDD